MTSANLRLVRSICQAWERGNWSNVDWAHPDIEYAHVDGPDPGRWTGLAGMAEAWGGFLDAWAEFRLEAEEYREVDDERVLVFNHFGGRGKTSGVEVGQTRVKAAALFQIRAGKVTRLATYWDRGRALADVGLASQPGSLGS